MATSPSDGVSLESSSSRQNRAALAGRSLKLSSACLLLIELHTVVCSLRQSVGLYEGLSESSLLNLFIKCFSHTIELSSGYQATPSMYFLLIAFIQISLLAGSFSKEGNL